MHPNQQTKLEVYFQIRGAKVVHLFEFCNKKTKNIGKKGKENSHKVKPEFFERKQGISLTK